VTDELATLLREFEIATVAVDAAMKHFTRVADQVRAAVKAAAPDDGGLEFVDLCVAAFDSGISESRLRDLCKLHPLDAPGGFGFKQGGRWKVHRRRYRAFCEAYPRKGRRKR